MVSIMPEITDRWRNLRNGKKRWSRVDSIPDSVVLQGKCKEPTLYGI